MRQVLGWCESPMEYFKKAIELNQKALTLNKNLFCATAMLGQIHLFQRQYEPAIEMGRRSIELGPNIAVNYVILASILYYAGHFEEAITMGEKAIRLHPFCPWYYLFGLAASYRMAGHYEEALSLYRQVLNRAQKEASTLYRFISGLQKFIRKWVELRRHTLKLQRNSPDSPELFIKELEQNAAFQGSSTS